MKKLISYQIFNLIILLSMMLIINCGKSNTHNLSDGGDSDSDSDTDSDGDTDSDTDSDSDSDSDTDGDSDGGDFCSSNEDCPSDTFEDSYCDFTAGMCGSEGTCIIKPLLCDEIYSPVCGCDNNTYANDCLRQARGVSKLFDGECSSNNECENNNECDPGEYCEFTEGMCGETGRCLSIPTSCEQPNDEPVCGCDNRTYLSDCIRRQAGVSKLHDGQCDVNPGQCRDNYDCITETDNQFCEQAEGMCSGLGECVDIPSECSYEYIPVCGCNNITYNNDCFRQQAGVSLFHTGECDTNPSECTENGNCDWGEFCEFTVGVCSGSGQCIEIPMNGCPEDLYQPVCGCDNVTYYNDCLRAASAVSKLYDGECEINPEECWNNGNCVEYWGYCEFDYGMCSGPGQCVPYPDYTCLEIYEPVCGCDNNTYYNDCFRQQAGISLLYEGECDINPSTCNDISDCEDGYFCEYEDNTCSGTGLCIQYPSRCSGRYEPVCGCDNNTYYNDCFRQAQGISQLYDGECLVSCTNNDECGDREFCELEEYMCSGTGTCTTRPTRCNGDWNPVCGCDNVTYDNDCFRQSVGISKAAEGECEIASDCNDNYDCGDGEFCEFYEPECGNLGQCITIPDIQNCTPDYIPVCGCNNVTYLNDCYRQAESISKYYDGECNN